MSKEERIILTWENLRTTSNLEMEKLNKFSEEQYKEVEKIMDIDLLHQVAEQRCKSFGCRLQNCLGKSGDTNKCLVFFRQLNYCKEFEFKKVKYEYLTTNKQPHY